MVGRSSYFVAIDLGSSSVIVAVGEKIAQSELKVLCTVTKPIEGVNAGQIDNIELVSNAISEAIVEAEEQIGDKILDVNINISGEFVRCAQHTDHIFVSDPQNGVSQSDVDALFDRMRNVQAPEGEEIMERIPQNYTLDDIREVKNPVGSFGRKLSSTFNFVLCHKTPIQRVEMALRRLGKRISSITSTVLVVPESLLSAEERAEGVAVVDIGGALTDVTIIYRNVVRYVVTIPIGANAINNDIRTMGVPERHVESLKQKYGTAVAELIADDKIIRVAGRTARDAKDILLRNLAIAIEARLQDIAEFVHQEIKLSTYGDKLAYGIVLSGGSAKLPNIDELFKRVTGMDARVGAPEVGIAAESLDAVDDPALATVVGLLLKVAAQAPISVGGSATQSASQTPQQSPIGVPPTPTQRATPPPAPAQQSVPPTASVEQEREEYAEPQQTPQEAPQQEPERIAERPKKNWGAIFQSKLDKINKVFSAPEDEEL